MTDKRFTDVWCSETGHIGVTDNGIDKEFTGSEFKEWLNSFNHENGQLKNLCKALIKRIEKESIAVIMTDDVKELLE